MPAISPRRELPVGWSYPREDDAQPLLQELQRELPPGHLLDGVSIEVFAWREGASDDVLFRHRHQPERFTIVHLTWSGRTEVDAEHPTVEFDGTFADFLTQEKELYGLTIPSQAGDSSNA